jgi:opacity protein-like surface antigen
VDGCLAVCTVRECLLGFLLLVALTAGLGSPASAGPYVAARGGLVWYPDVSGAMISPVDPADPQFVPSPLAASFDLGYNIGAAMGWRLGWFRAEVEGAYRSNEMSSLLYLLPSPGSRTGRMSSASALFNTYADIDFGLPVVPYVGLGIGYSRVMMTDLSPTPSFFSKDTRDSQFAYQVMGGLGFPIPKVPLTLSAGYRYFSTGTARLRFTGPAGNYAVELKYRLHEFVADLRWEF